MSDMSAEEQVMQLWQQALSGRSRKERQIAAHAFAVASVSVPEKVAAYADVLVSAVGRPRPRRAGSRLTRLLTSRPMRPRLSPRHLRVLKTACLRKSRALCASMRSSIS